jgi:hypothetical protein
MKYTILLLASFAFFTVEASSQCRGFTKRNCVPILEDYLQNDNYNAAILIPGDEAELDMAFYGGVSYRIVVCSHSILGDVEFSLNDYNGNALWTNTDGEKHLDIQVATTQQLSVKIKIPSNESSLIHEGCVSIMLGSKE